jgi:hypothetical protein
MAGSISTAWYALMFFMLPLAFGLAALIDFPHGTCRRNRRWL